MGRKKTKSMNIKNGLEKRDLILERIKSFQSIKDLYKRNPFKAKSELIHFLNKYPDDTFALALYGKICEESNDYDEAKKYYSMVASSSTAKNRAEGITGLGDIARKTGNYSEAKDYYRRAIKENDSIQISALLNLIHLECLDENYDEALRLTSKLDGLEKELTYRKDLILGEIYSRKGDFKNAMIHLDKCINSGVKDVSYYKAMLEEGKIYLEQGEYDMALENGLVVYNNKEDFNGNTQLFLGNCYYALGKYKEALDMLESSLHHNQISNKVKCIDCLFIGRINILLDNYDEALKYLTTCFELKCSSDVNNLSLVFGYLSNIYIHKNDLDKLQELINKASSLPSASKIERLGIASSYLRIKRGEKIKHHHSSYRSSQIVSYDKEKALSHIINHHGSSQSKGSRFDPNLDIRSLMDEIDDKLTPSNMRVNNFFDKYLIPYPNVGFYENGMPIDLLGVVTLPGTKDIITMYPFEGQKEPTKGDVKKCFAKEKAPDSSIQKFNKRFAKFTQQANNK